MITLALPFTPSTNHYWRHVGLPNRAVKVYISKQGKEYRERVARIIAGSGFAMVTSRVFMRVDLYPPDKRDRDLDNFDSKALCDALTYGGLLEDDKLIRGRLSWFHDEETVKGGLVVVKLQPIESVADIFGANEDDF